MHLGGNKSIFECLEPYYLNSLFFSPEEDSDKNDDGCFYNTDTGFKPIPDRYFCGEKIELTDYGINLDDGKNGSNVKCFSSLGINIRSLANTKNFTKLQAFMDSLCFVPTVVAINETYLRDNDEGPHCNLRDYKFISNCRKSFKGGGVGLYVHRSLKFKIRKDLTFMEDKVFESLFIETLNLKEPLLFGTVYRSPNNVTDTVSKFTERLEACLKIIDKTAKPCFIQGDLNFNLIDLDDNNINKFKELMIDSSFYSLINKPTRIGRASATCIDHIWSNMYNDSIVSGIITEMIADHMITFQSSNLEFKHLTSKNSENKKSSKN